MVKPIRNWISTIAPYDRNSKMWSGLRLQYFCGEQVFRHELPFERSSLTRCRQRLGHLAALLQESQSVAHKTGALETKVLERVALDTTVQPKAVAHVTDARLMYRAIEKLGHSPSARGAPAPELYPGGQRGPDHGRALHPRPSVQAYPADAQVPAPDWAA